MAVAFLDGAGVAGFTAGADYAVGPALRFEEVNRGLLVWIPLEEFKDTDVAFVVVVDGDWVFGHVVFLDLKLGW